MCRLRGTFASVVALLVLLRVGVPQGHAAPAAPHGQIATTGFSQQAAPQAPVAPPVTESPEPALPRPSAPLDPAVLAPRLPLQVIVIDPGHGGDDAGVKGPGIEEKQLTLDVARRLRALLEKTGFKVVMTRDGDTSMDAGARSAAANAAGGDLFLSLHANAAHSPTPSGAEIYSLLADPAVDQARQRALKTSVTIPVAGGGTRSFGILPWRLAQAPYVDASAALAAMVAEHMKPRVPLGSVPVRKGPLRVVESVAMPAIVVEMAYLSNPTQAKLAASTEFRDAVALALHDSIVRFRARVTEGKVTR